MLELIEAAAFSAALVATLALIARRAGATQARGGVAAAAWLVVTAVAFAGILGFRRDAIPESEVADRPIVVDEPGYVTSDTCQGCHPREHATWHASYHRTMTQVATPETVLGDFDDVELELQGKTYHLTTEDDSLWVELDSPLRRPGMPVQRVKRRVVLTTGSHHDQNYWYELGTEGRGLALLPFDFSRREDRWVPFNSTFITPPGAPPPFHVATWNTVCMRCHTTAGATRKTPSAAARRNVIDSKVVEFGIACEACHGPAEAHVERHRGPWTRFAHYLFDLEDDSIVNPGRLDARRGSEVCGSCHGISFARPSAVPEPDVGEWPERVWQPGMNLHDSRIFLQSRFLDPEYETDDVERQEYLVDLVREQPHFKDFNLWPDGMVRVSGRDFSGMMEAPCFERGEMSCMSCHELHQSSDDPREIGEWANDMLRHTATGIDACTDCHPQLSTPGSIAAHTHHPPSSSGSNCYNCHMPHTVYGIQKATRSHHIDAPDVSVALATGRPNACNLCHLDRTLEWTATHLQDWYGQPKPELDADRRTVAEGVLTALEGDAGVRALMAWHFGWKEAREASGSDWMTHVLGHLLADPYDSVRFIAIQSLRSHPGFEGFEYDFVVPGAAQQEAVSRARQIAEEISGVESGQGRPELLQDADGRISYARLQHHSEQRDDRPIVLSE